MTPKPRIWKLRHLDRWMVRCYTHTGPLGYQLRNFRTWEEALAFALAVIKEEGQEPPC